MWFLHFDKATSTADHFATNILTTVPVAQNTLGWLRDAAKGTL